MYSTGIAYLLWLCSGCGVLGLHRFYLGKTGTGLLWMLTGGLGTIGAFYDLFTLPGQVREANIREAIHEESIRRKVEERQGKNSWRNVDDGKFRIIPQEKEKIERVILRLAKENKGILTASELALSANISIEDAKKDLDAMVSKGFAELRVRQSGSLVYTIPDLMDSNEPLVD
ncbi:MAG: TM2 domain-containing protein [Treponema sp.]|jgi:TM2 domain-containing membrane protein YozV/predicted transcriptional regulator|nr:TM2 domain-containing protein [Treponema sp.]